MRSPEEVLNSHLELRDKGDLEEDITKNYAEDVVVIDSYGAYRGHDGVRRSAEILKRSLGGAKFSYKKTIVEGGIGYLLWGAQGDGARVGEGVDSFWIQEGKIKAQTVYYRAKKS